MSAETLAPTEEALVSHSETLQIDALTAERAANLFFYSFKFSQGSSKLQTYIFEYLHVLHPDWKMDEELKSSALKLLIPMITGFVEKTEKINHPSVYNETPGYVTNHVQDRLEDMQSQLAFEGKVDRQGLVIDITNLAIEEDYRFICRPDKHKEYGRRRTKAKKMTPEKDPFLSQVYYYGLEGNTTKIPEYDSMFAEVKAAIESDPEMKTDPTTPLFYVISNYEKNGHERARLYKEQSTSQE